MKTISRREAIGTLAMSGATLAGVGTSAVQTKAFAGLHQVKALPFNPAKLNGLSEKLIRSHHENNYSGAVRALNAVEQRLASMLADKDLPAYLYGDLKREELVRTGSVVLHEIYFAVLGGDGKAAGDILSAIKQTFGTAEQWDAEFRKTGNALGGGSSCLRSGCRELSESE